MSNSSDHENNASVSVQVVPSEVRAESVCDAESRENSSSSSSSRSGTPNDGSATFSLEETASENALLAHRPVTRRRTREHQQRHAERTREAFNALLDSLAVLQEKQNNVIRFIDQDTASQNHTQTAKVYAFIKGRFTVRGLLIQQAIEQCQEQRVLHCAPITHTPETRSATLPKRPTQRVTKRISKTAIKERQRAKRYLRVQDEDQLLVRIVVHLREKRDDECFEQKHIRRLAGGLFDMASASKGWYQGFKGRYALADIVKRCALREKLNVRAVAKQPDLLLASQFWRDTLAKHSL